MDKIKNPYTEHDPKLASIWDRGFNSSFTMRNPFLEEGKTFQDLGIGEETNKFHAFMKGWNACWFPLMFAIAQVMLAYESGSSSETEIAHIEWDDLEPDVQDDYLNMARAILGSISNMGLLDAVSLRKWLKTGEKPK